MADAGQNQVPSAPSLQWPTTLDSATTTQSLLVPQACSPQGRWGQGGEQVPPARLVTVPGRPLALCSWQDIVALQPMPAQVEFHGPTEFLGSLAFSLVPGHGPSFSASVPLS